MRNSDRIIFNVKWKDEEIELSTISQIFVKRNPVLLKTLPKREATIEERRKMMGSIGTMYETNVPILYCSETKKFFLIDYFEQTAIIFDEEVELEILKAGRLLPSVFRKIQRKPKQAWR
jgi:hypothetical protein